jgi:hypothetical protein
MTRDEADGIAFAVDRIRRLIAFARANSLGFSPALPRAR